MNVFRQKKNRIPALVMELCMLLGCVAYAEEAREGVVVYTDNT